MPVQPCTTDGKPGRRWGEEGKCYPCDGDDCADAHAKAEAQGKAIGENGVITSAAGALADRARMEYKAAVAVTRQASDFLEDVYHLALRDRLYLSAGSVHGLWQEHMAPEALTGIPAELAHSLSESLAFSPLPDEVFTTVQAAMRVADDQALSDRDVGYALALVLDLETASLTAAGIVQEVIKDIPVKSWIAMRNRRKGAKKKLKIAARNALNAKLGYTWAWYLTELVTTKVTEFKARKQEEAMTVDGYTTKMWVTRRDDRVRDEHAEADGQTVPVFEPFMVGGYAMQYPGDESAPYHLTINCRCVLVPGRP